MFASWLLPFGIAFLDNFAPADRDRPHVIVDQAFPRLAVVFDLVAFLRQVFKPILLRWSLHTHRSDHLLEFTLRLHGVAVVFFDLKAG